MQKTTRGRATYKNSSKKVDEDLLSNAEIDSTYEPKNNCKDPQCTYKRPHTHNFVRIFHK